MKMDLRLKPQCCSCFESFNNGEFYPRLMKCSHSICNHCAKKSEIICNECADNDDSFAGRDEAAAIEEIDFYNLGLVETFKRKWHTLTFERKSKKPDSICYECQQILASKKCIQCGENYCEHCSTKVHFGRIMGSHEVMDIDESTVFMFNGYCSQHQQKPFTSYCKECKNHLCVDCVSEHSNEHASNVANIAELNKTEKPNESTQNKVIRELDENKFLLERLLETLSTKEVKEKDELKQFCDLVQRESGHLHGLIQNLEKMFLKQAAEAVNEMLDEIDDHKNEVRKGIQLINDTKVKFTVAQPPENIYLKSMVKETKDNSIMVIEKGNELTKRSNIKPSFTGFKKRTTQLKAVVSGNANCSAAKREPTIFRDLVRTDQRTSSSTLTSFERDQIGGQQLTNKESQKSNHFKFMRPQHSTNGDVHPTTDFHDVFNGIGETKLNEMQSMHGRNASNHKKDDWYQILKYKSPFNFTIQNKSISHEKEMFQKQLNRLAPSWGIERNPKKDNIYAVYCTGKWVRAKLADNLDTNFNDKWFHMVDDGGCYRISTDKCKIIEDNEIRKKSPYAIWCGLFDVQKDEWSNELLDRDREIIENKLFKVVFLYQKINHHTKVDLIFEDNKRFLSLKDTLESAGLLKSSRHHEKTHKYPGFMSIRNKILSTTERHVNLVEPTMNVPTPILILQIESVCEFYCIQLKDASTRARVKKELNSIYSSTSYEATLAYVLVDDMIYAAKIDDKWHRVKVLDSKGDGLYLVFLIDDGIKSTIHWENLYHLKEEFAQFDQFVFQASLFRINDDEDEDEQTEKFRKMNDDDCKFTAEFTDSIANIYIATVTVEICNREYNVKELLLKDRNAISAVNSSPANQKKIKIKVKHVVSPSEFYIVLNERQEELEQLHERIQHYVEVDRKTKSKIDWNVGERCIVKVNKSEWYRGIILKPKDECTVFLRDIGKMVTAQLPEELREDNMGESMPGTIIRCHLAYLQPSSIHSWTLTACDHLKAYSLQAKEVTIEIPDVNCVLPSIPVILWASMNKITCAALEPAKPKWLNVNLRMINQGLAYPTTPDIDAFTPLTTKPFNEKRNHFVLIESLVKRYGENLDRSVSQGSQIKGRGVAMNWLPAHPLETKDFIGVPEWVDDDSIVYLHTIEQREELAKMTQYMTKWIESFGEDEINDWGESDICYAKFNGQYHRAEIKHVYKNEHRCMVYFVDYGNMCEVENADLSRYILYDEVPIMLYKLRLNSIKPKTKSGKWTKDAIETLSQYICHKECNIFVHDSDDLPESPLLCRIQPTQYSLDAATFLIQHQKAYRIERVNDENDNSTEHLLKRSDKNKSPPLKIDHTKIQNVDDLRSGFQFNKILVPIKCKKNNDEDDGPFQSDHSLLNLHQYRKELAARRIANESTFSPDPTIVTITSHFKLMELDANQPIFKCRIVYVIDPITVLIKPKYADKEEIDPSLMDSMHNADLNSPCIAFCSRTQTFERGIVRTDRPSKDAMIVTFVDSLTSEIVPTKKIRECPRSLLEKPVNLVRVLLHGVKPHNRCREQDVRNQLKIEIATNDEYHAKIKEYKDVPEVKFYDDDNNAITNILVYRKFYKKIRKS